MSGQQTQQQQQQAVSSPWAPAIPYLTNYLSKVGGQSTSVTPDQSAALGGLRDAAHAIPNMGPQATSAANFALGTNTSPQIGMLKDSLGQYNSDINSSGINKASSLNPASNPYLSSALYGPTGMLNQIINQTKSSFAGSGNDPAGSSAFASSVGKSASDALAPALMGQYNTNVANFQNANNAQFGTNAAAAGDITNQGLSEIQGQGAGLGFAGMLPQLYMNPANAAYGAANMGYQQPYQNLNFQSMGLLGPASLGGQTSGTGSTTTTGSPWTTLAGLGMAGLSLMPK